MTRLGSVRSVPFIAALFLTLTLHAAPRNVVFVLSDDHRYDFMGFLDGPAFLETPHMDRMAAEGAYFENAFVSTSLCSPSRASILTGRYMRAHRVVDNQRAVPAGTVFFPQHLQRAGYDTAYVGKWHMGHDSDDPRPGFDHWVSFRGQGTYYDPVLNTNGGRKKYSGYTADILTTQAMEWLEREREKPFFLYLGFKSVHYPFLPAERHRGRYRDAKIDYPETMANSDENYRTQPRWVRERRYSIHGIDHMETGAFDKDPVPSFDDLYRRYAETVHGLDENLGRLLDYLDRSGLSRTTTVIYMGDNGFALGEHGFYDKRDAFEESIRVPLLAYGPGYIAAGTRIQQLVQNVDIAPSVLDMAGLALDTRKGMSGRSFLPLLHGKSLSGTDAPWRKFITYEYYWEWNFPATPTTFAIREERYKYIYYHGVWDDDGLYDLTTDPHERHNIIHVPAYQERVVAMREKLFDELGSAGDLVIPIRRPRGERLGDRKLRR
jgi:N-acetylglucosamine-6-sulfatase